MSHPSGTSGAAPRPAGVRQTCSCDDGAGTALMLSVIALAVVGLLVVGSMAQAVLARRQASTAADLAALAAADLSLVSGPGPPGTGPGPCPAAVAARAASVAEVNRATMDRCTLAQDGSVTIDVHVWLTGVVAAAGPARATARAGLPPPDG